MSAEPDGPRATPQKPNPWAIAIGAGTQFAVSVGGGCWLGYWLDGRLGTGSWLTIVGMLLGFFVGLYNLVRSLARGKNGGPIRG